MSYGPSTGSIVLIFDSVIVALRVTERARVTICGSITGTNGLINHCTDLPVSACSNWYATSITSIAIILYASLVSSTFCRLTWIDETFDYSTRFWHRWCVYWCKCGENYHTYYEKIHLYLLVLYANRWTFGICDEWYHTIWKFTTSQ